MLETSSQCDCYKRILLSFISVLTTCYPGDIHLMDAAGMPFPLRNKQHQNTV